MSKMCNACGSEGITMDETHSCPAWSSSSCCECDQGEKSSVLNGDMGSLSVDVSPCSTPYGTPLFSRESSFSSFTSCFSSLGESRMDTDSEEREEEIGQSNPNIVCSDGLLEQEKGGLVEVADFRVGHVIVVDDGVSFPMSASENISSDKLQLHTHEDSTKENIEVSANILDTSVSYEPPPYIPPSNHFTENENEESVDDIGFRPSNVIDVEEVTSFPMSSGEIIPLNQQLLDHQDAIKENAIVYNNIFDTDSNIKSEAHLENGSDYVYPLVLPSFDTDPLIWIPPEPANKEDEINTVANNDDDSDNGDTTWGQSSFSISFDEQRKQENREEQLQKAMLEVMNGQFKDLVGQFLAAEGFLLSDGGVGKSWLDIVTSLSWNAALLIKPDANVGNEMDPGLYVKVKCIASRSRQQSEVIKGLVFKKSAARKQMRANIKHPRLLLLQGILGHSSVGLSSMNSMKQENEQLEKCLNEVIGKCHPDVILVEKAVTRNVNEYLQKQGVTLVSEMNICRLERIARCTGSPIISMQDVLTKPNLEQCESVHFERFVEEHNMIGEDGRRSSKTFLFLVGFPKPLGCTILLKGATSEELKKIKRVLHFTVFAAYHLILETSFFADQRVFLAEKIGIGKENYSKTDRKQSCGAASHSKLSSDGSTKRGIPKYDLNIPTSDEQCSLSDEPWRSYVRTEKSPSSHCHDTKIKSVVNEVGCRDIVEERLNDGKGIQSASSLPVPESSSASFGDKSSSDCAESTSGHVFDEARDQTMTFTVTSEEAATQKKEVSNKIGQENFDGGKSAETGTALHPHNILILMSSQHIRNQAICEQSHLSRITYYGYFDMSLGRYLQDTLLNKHHCCSSCGDPPEAHMYSYTHHNGTLTVLIKSVPSEATLSGERQRRIWMWTRCLRCNGKPTKRVVISSSARSLSFGKFLELSFSTHSAAKKLSTCGHLLHRDCLRFFGLGSKVAMFRYSSLEIYSACKPSLACKFYNPNKQEWLGVEVQKVLHRGKLLFSEIENIIQDLKTRYIGQISEKNAISTYDEVLLEVTKIFMQEKNEFEVSLESFDHFSKAENCIHEILGLNWLYQQLLLLFYIWDQRLHYLLHYKKFNGASPDSSVHESLPENEQQILGNSAKMAAHGSIPSSEDLGMEGAEVTGNSSNKFHNSCGDVVSETGQHSEKSIAKEHESTSHPDLDVMLSESSPSGVCENGSDQMQDRDEQPAQNAKRICSDKTADLAVTSDEQTAQARCDEMYPVAMRGKYLHMFPNSIIFTCDETRRCVWTNFSHLKMDYKEELQCGSLDKFHLINKYIPTLSSLAQLKQKMDLVHFTLGPGGNILFISEEEISSIIAYALSISEDQGISSAITYEKDELEARRKFDKITEKPSNLDNDNSKLSSNFSLNASLEKMQNLSTSLAISLSSKESTSGFYDSFLSALKDLHPEICLNSGKVALKSKYTVVSIYAKQFYGLRKMCCPSELAYISSISRCKKWNAQGGKSKAFFAKSMDDRFIIKQIKKTEFDSFLKFGLEYLKQLGVSPELRNPTCLAKILGIYQVKEIKNGKERRTNLMVMENLLFGHNILRRYDLKGALFSRYVSDSNNPEKVLLDQNFIEDMRTMPIYLEGKTKNLMERAIWNDTSFLSNLNVMDYSLFVGVDKQKKELVFGIIDYLRQYTWDKQLESWVKTSVVVPKNLSPTVISPKEYKIRFRAFMAQYFLSVPDA